MEAAINRRASPAWAAIVAAAVSGLTLTSLAAADGDGHRPPSDTELHPLAELMLRRPLHFAHRGGADNWPENTLFAFEHAATDAQADVLELDVHLSADGVAVVIHDDTVDRTTDGSGEVRAKTLAELKSLDAAWDFTEDGHTYPYRGLGITIPTLEEVFEAVTDPEPLAGRRPFINIELKVPDRRLEEAVADLIEDFELADRTCVGSFYTGSGRRLKERIPEACSYYTLGAGLCYGLDVLATPSLEGCPDFDVLEIPWQLLEEPWGARLLEEAEEDGIPIVVWTVNGQDQMEALLERDIGGIMSDEALLLRRVMNDAGYPPAPEADAP